RHRSTAMRVGEVKGGGIFGRDRTGEHDLSLYTCDSIDREAVLALKIPDELAEIGIEHIAHRSITVRALHALQALAKPPNVIASHPLRERLYLTGTRSPQHYKITEPVA